MRAGSKWSCTNPVNDNWIEGDLYNSLSMTAALVHTRPCTLGFVHTAFVHTTCTRGLSTHGVLGHVACTLRSVHHGHPRQYTGLYTTVCNHDLYTMACTHGLYTWLAHTTLYTWLVHVACTRGLYTWPVHASHGLPGSRAKVRWKGQQRL